MKNIITGLMLGWLLTALVAVAQWPHYTTKTAGATPNMAAVTGVLSPANGGTGNANDVSSTLIRTGAHAVTITTTAATHLYLPTAGTVATVSGTETLTNKTLTNPKITKQTLTSGATVSWDISAGNMADVTITTAGAVFVSPTNVTVGSLALRVLYSGSGTVSPTVPFFKFAGGTQPSWSNTAGKIDMLTCNVYFTGGLEALCAATLDVR